MLFYLSYLRAFRTYAYFNQYKYSEFTQIGDYASDLTRKANSLLTRAALNKVPNLALLQKDMFEAGSVYVKKFAIKFKKPENENLVTEEIDYAEINRFRRVPVTGPSNPLNNLS